MLIKVCDICGAKIEVGDPARIKPLNSGFVVSVEKVVTSAKNTTVCDICDSCKVAIMNTINDIYAGNPYNPDRTIPVWHPGFTRMRAPTQTQLDEADDVMMGGGNDEL